LLHLDLPPTEDYFTPGLKSRSEGKEESALEVDWEQVPLLCIRESVSSLVRELGALLVAFSSNSAKFLNHVHTILLQDIEGGLKSKQARLSLQLQIQALKRLVDIFQPMLLTPCSFLPGGCNCAF